jgi:hypothetical protein
LQRFLALLRCRSEQVVFSIAPTFTESFGPFGFWIWCEAKSTNPYVGECAGTIYFYGTTAVEQVADQASIAEGPGGIYTISIDTSDISCTLTNETPSPHGSNQKIDVSCTSPFSGSASVTGVVNGECPIRCVGMTETEERRVYEDRPA